MTQAHLFGAAGRTDAPEVLAALEVDYTPPAVAVQLVLAFGIEFVIHRPRVLDLAAGSGSWSRAARACLPGCYIVGVDARESERANLEAACDEVFIGTFFDLSFERRRPSWICEQLLELPGPWRKWSPTAVPGTYPIDQALVDEIRTRYL